MSSEVHVERWLERFPALRQLEPEHLDLALEAVQFPLLKAGDVAYREHWPCPNYVMCVDGLTRVFKASPEAREMLIYRVQAGGTCVLTTQCLLSGGNFPAESVAEEDTRLAAIPKPTFVRLMSDSARFRDFVLSDYATLLSQLFTLLDEVAFSSMSRRLALRLVADASGDGQVHKTHQQLASDIGTVREVVSRQLSEWETAGLLQTGRGEIRVLNKTGLASIK